MKEGKDIDKLFKDGLGDPEIPFNDLDWDNLEERLHPKEKKRIVPIIWFAAIAGIAAMLLIVFLLVKPEAVSDRQVQVKNKTGNQHQEGTTPTLKRETPETALADEGAKSVASGFSASNTKNNASQQDVKQLNPGFQDQIKTDLVAVKSGFYNNTLADVNPTRLNSSIDPIEFEDQALRGEVFPKKTAVMKDLITKKKTRLVLSILAAPDVTSVQKSGRSSLSGSFGLEATLFLTKKLSVTTGAAYAKKIYDSDFSLYNPNSSYVFKVQPSNIHANCDVIDIPLNVNYRIFDNRRNAITVSTGLSSYLMLKERYAYTYNSGYAGPQGFQVNNQNQHYLGVANVGVEFQHKINQKLSISARPFMKVPLTNIGYGNSKLSSTGVAVSVNMNLFKGN